VRGEKSNQREENMKRGMVSLGVESLVFLLALGSATAGPITFSDDTNNAGVNPGKKGSGIGPAFGDYDNDGDMDIYLSLAFHGPSFLGRNNRLWENDGSGHFRNVATGKGVDNITPDGVSGLGRGVSWGDCDNDGDLDLLVGNMGSTGEDPPVPHSTLYINNGPPNFEFTWTSCSRGLHQEGEQCTDDITGGLKGTSGGIAWGDYDNDGCLDIYWRITDWHVDNVLLKNQKQGGKCTCTFKEVTEQAGVKLLYPLRKTTFDGEETDPPRSLVIKANCQGNANWVDYDNDGDLDLLNPNEGDMNVLFRNDGNGTFTDVTTVRGREGKAFANIGDAQGACWGDVDNDGDLDAYLENAGQANRLIRNDLMETGKPGFTDITFKELLPRGDPKPPAWPDSGAGDFGDARGCTMGDYDNDGYLDIYVNNGGSTDIWFNDTNPMDPLDTQFYVAETPGHNALLRNNGNNTFTDVTEGSGGNVFGEGRGVATGDYNDDGLLDLYVTNFEPEGGERQEGVLLKNTTKNSNNWINVEVRGTVSNRSGIGVRVKCVSPSFTQIREVTSAAGYNSQDDTRAHFGLGSDTTVASIEVTWPAPNSSVQKLTNPGVNKMYVCTEGSGCVGK
jgi:hypothetical protein